MQFIAQHCSCRKHLFGLHGHRWYEQQIPLMLVLCSIRVCHLWRRWPFHGLSEGYGHFCLNYSVVCCALSVVTVAGARQCSAAAAASTACLSHSRQISNSKSLVVTCDWGGRGDNRLSCKLQHCVHSCVVLPGAVMLLTDQHSDNCRLNALVNAWRLILRGIQG